MTTLLEDPHTFETYLISRSLNGCLSEKKVLNKDYSK